jgi:hypothetical protein
VSQPTEEATVDPPPEPTRAMEKRSTPWQRFAEAMRMYLTEHDGEAAREALVAALTATRRQKVFVVLKDDATGKTTRFQDYEEVPDHVVRVAAATKILEWCQGRPIERVQVDTQITGPAERQGLTAADLRGMLAESPSLAGEILESIVRSAKPAEAANDKTVTQQPAANQLIGNQEVPRG